MPKIPRPMINPPGEVLDDSISMSSISAWYPSRMPAEMDSLKEALTSISSLSASAHRVAVLMFRRPNWLRMIHAFAPARSGRSQVAASGAATAPRLRDRPLGRVRGPQCCGRRSGRGGASRSLATRSGAPRGSADYVPPDRGGPLRLNPHMSRAKTCISIMNIPPSAAAICADSVRAALRSSKWVATKKPRTPSPPWTALSWTAATCA